jgi:hypothetical protein
MCFGKDLAIPKLRRQLVGAGTSIFLIAVGAIMDFAVKVQNNHGFNINRIGLILMIVGIVGLVLSLAFWNSWGGFGSYRRRRVVTGVPYQQAAYGRGAGAGHLPRAGNLRGRRAQPVLTAHASAGVRLRLVGEEDSLARPPARNIAGRAAARSGTGSRMGKGAVR